MVKLENIKLRFAYYFGIGIFTLVIFSYACASDLDSLKVNYLNGNYKQVIKEGEKLLVNLDHNNPEMDELYYILGLSYLKESNYLRASDIFEILINEFKSNRFKPQAKLALADTYLLRKDYSSAEKKYRILLNDRDCVKFKTLIEKRLTMVKETAIKNEEPVVIQKEYDVIMPDEYAKTTPEVFSVQVGAFSSSPNAERLVRRLKDKGYEAYVDETVSGVKKSYKVKTGKFVYRSQAAALEKKLAKEGFPTKICP